MLHRFGKGNARFTSWFVLWSDEVHK